MMKRLRIFLLMILCLLLISGCKKKKDINEKKTGKIFLSTTIQYDEDDEKQAVFEYDANGNIIKWESYSIDGGRAYWYTCDYDDNNNQIKKTEYNANGKIIQKLISECDETGHISNSKMMDAYGNVISITKYEYDAMGNVVRYITFSSEGEVEGRTDYEYDANWNVLEISYDADDNVTSEISYLADKKITEAKLYTNGKVTSWIKYEYTSDGKPLKNMYLDAEGVQKNYVDFEFDERDNIIKYNQHYGNNVITLNLENVYSDGRVTGGKSK